MRITKSVIALSALLSLQAFSAVNVLQVQKEIQAQGAQWKAGHTWVSDLAANDVKRMMGNREEVKNNLDYSDAYSHGASYEAVDWRNMDGVNWSKICFGKVDVKALM